MINIHSLSQLSHGLIREILIRIWHHQQWPVSQMTYERWQKMAEQICSATTADNYVENLPGDIRFEIDGKIVRITA